MSSVAVIDYGMGNLHSIAKALQHADPGCDVRVVATADEIMQADRVVFPGVGAIRDCMAALGQSGLATVIKETAKTKPFLGICLGMQALLTDNEENGFTPTLDIIKGHVVRFPEPLIDQAGNHLKIPHMGWNQVLHQASHPLWESIPQNSRFYFVHSYYAKPDDSVVIAGTSEYPGTFACALAQGSLFAVQFHPEKSQAFGLQLLKNFLHWDGGN
jgi:imidazole glycerol-phosphate synthase subunit HisH